jgi:ABC-2 type transport system permease protein
VLPTVSRNVRLYFRLQITQLRALIEYRADFWIGIAGAALQQCAGLVFISALFSQIPEVQGWTVWNVAILYGLVIIPTGFVELFCDGPWRLRADINQGNFDRVLVRPVSPALQQATAFTSIHGLGQVGLGVVVLSIGLSRSAVQWEWWSIPFLVVVLICAATINGAMNFVVNMTGFWEPSTASAFPTMVVSMREFAKFPLDLYGIVLKVVVTLILPFAFVSYFPTLLLLDRGGRWQLLGLASPVVAALVVLATAWLWRRGLDRYQGVGH